MYYEINGGNKLRGEYEIKGSKNATLPILIATLLIEEEVILENCPNLADIEHTIEILKSLGCCVKREGSCVVVCAKEISSLKVSKEIGEKMRSSILFLGALLAREKEASIPCPGGCVIGKRPIDIHLKAFERMGVCIEEREEMYECLVSDGGKRGIGNGEICLSYPSVGATENILLLAVLTAGQTTIINPAKEPEIVSLVEFLRVCGANISGEGTGRIVVEGVKKLHGTKFCLPFDRIEAGTYLYATALTKGEILLKDVHKGSMELVTNLLRATGCEMKWYEKEVYLKAPNRLKSNFRITTAPYPKFSTDMQPLTVALLTLSQGRSMIKETVFEDRFSYVLELRKMGAKISVRNNCAVVCGCERLKGTTVIGKDLRGGMALVLAGLVAEGTSQVYGVEFMQRGYETIEKNYMSLGADIKLV